MIYLINLLAIPLYYLFITIIYKTKEKRERAFFILFGLHTVLFRVLANPLNYVDTEGYAMAYERISDMSFKEAMTSQYVLWGVGYVFLNWLLTRLSSDPMVLFSFISVLSVGGVVWFYKKTSHSLFATGLFYVIYGMLYLFGFGVIRQPLAIVFALLALYYIDNFKKSFLLAVIAILLHTSCVIFLPFYLWKYFRFEKRSLLTMAIVITIGFLALRFTMNFFLTFLERAQQTGFGEEGDNNYLPVLILGTTVLLFYLTRTNYRLKQGYEKNIFSFVIYGLMVSLFGIGLHGAGRLTLMFIYVFPVAITFVKTYSGKKGLPIYYLYYTSLLLLLSFLFINSYDSARYDYVAIWETVSDYK